MNPPQHTRSLDGFDPPGRSLSTLRTPHVYYPNGESDMLGVRVVHLMVRGFDTCSRCHEKLYNKACIFGVVHFRWGLSSLLRITDSGEVVCLKFYLSVSPLAEYVAVVKHLVLFCICSGECKLHVFGFFFTISYRFCRFTMSVSVSRLPH